MMTKGKKILIIVLAVAIAIAGSVFAVVTFANKSKNQTKIDTNGAAVSVSQNGDTIVFNPDNTYQIQGDVEVEGHVFDYETQGTYAVTDGKLVLNEKNPKVAVFSTFGQFDMDGDITSLIENGMQIVHLEASNEASTFVLAHFELGKEQADKLGIKGITGESWENDVERQEAEETETEEPTLDASGALLTVESGGNRIAFFPDGTFKLLAKFTQSGDGLTVNYSFEVTDKYSVKDGELILSSDTEGLLNADIFKQYGQTDVKTPTKCTVKVVDGLLEIRFTIQTGKGTIEAAVFKIGKADAEKIGVMGITGETVIVPSTIEATQTSETQNIDNAPSQQAVDSSAKPISFSNGNYQITFYSNGQYKETGTIDVNGAKVSVSVTDEYTIDKKGKLTIKTNQEVSCSAVMSGYDLSFGAPNKTSCEADGKGCKVTFIVYANDQNNTIGSVKLSAADIEKIKENYGLKGETPSDEKDVKDDKDDKDDKDKPSYTDNTITLSSDNGINLTFDTSTSKFSIDGKTVYAGLELASYQLSNKTADYVAKENSLSLANAKLKITALHDMAASAAGEFDVAFTVSKTNNQLTIAMNLPGSTEPLAVFELTKVQAKKLGIDIDKYQQKPEEPEVPEDSVTYTANNDATTIVFYKDYSAFNVSGSGKLTTNGVEADLTFQMADMYSVNNGGVTATNIANALKYTITLYGQSQETTANPETTIVKDGDKYKVTVKTTVNGQTITLCTGTVDAKDVEND